MHTQIERFHSPASLEEAMAILAEPANRALAVAGATEVALRVRNDVRALVDLSGLGLDRIWKDDRGLHLGAMVRAARIHRDPLVRAAVGDALPLAAFAIASETVRNLTTLGGNVVHLTSWSDTPVALLVLGARFRIQGPRGADRWVDADAFFAQQPRKLLGPGELVTEVLVPARAPQSGSHFIKYAKTAVDFALVNAAAEVTLDGDVVSEVRIGVGAIHTPPIRVTDAEAVVRGTTLDAATLEAAARAVAARVTPRRDARASAGYLKHSAGVVVKRCLDEAARRAKGQA